MRERKRHQKENMKIGQMSEEKELEGVVEGRADEGENSVEEK
jgi:hypothetical protein